MKCSLDCLNRAEDLTLTYHHEGEFFEIPICRKHWDEWYKDEDKFVEKQKDNFLDYIFSEYEMKPMSKDEIYDEKTDREMHRNH